MFFVSQQKKKKTLGFTLIELLVVISIISFMSSIVLSALSAARIKSRDTRRLRDIRELQKALVLYRDSAGQYPLGGTSPDYVLNAHSSVTSGTFSWTNLNPLITGKDKSIPSLPKDPINGSLNGVTYQYRYAAAATSNFFCPAAIANKVVLYFQTEQRDTTGSNAFGTLIDKTGSVSTSEYCIVVEP